MSRKTNAGTSQAVKADAGKTPPHDSSATYSAVAYAPASQTPVHGSHWRRMLLSTVAVLPLMAYGARQARSQVIPPAPPCDTVVGTTVTCTGDVSAGISPFGDIFATLNVNSLTANITPAAGIPGIVLNNGIYDANINSDTGAFSIATTGDNAAGIFAYSFFGAASVNSNGDISTLGNNSAGIYAGSTGDANVTSTGNISTVGDNSAGISSGSYFGEANVTSVGDISTVGDGSAGIYSGSYYGGTTVNSTGDISTLGNNSEGIRAYTYYNATVTSNGSIFTQGNYSAGIFAYGYYGAANVTSTGDIATQGAGSAGVYAYGYYGANVASTGNISTQGIYSPGITAYGGYYGQANVTSTGDISTQGAGSAGIYAGAYNGATVTSTGDISTIGDYAYGIAAFSYGGSNVTSTGNITTQGNNAFGIAAFSYGAASVMSTGNISTQGDDAFGIGAYSYVGANVTSTGNISTQGARADGIRAYGYNGVNVASTGDITVAGADGSAVYSGAGPGGNIAINILGGTLQGGSGAGAGIMLYGGNDNLVNNRGTIFALSGNAIIGDTGNDRINNFGTVTGNVNLGAGTNAFFNRGGGLFNSGPIVNLGAGNLLTNAGTLNPGGAGTVRTTALTGNFLQTGPGMFAVDINAIGGLADLLNVTGTANVAGTVVPNLLNLDPTPREITILSAAGGTANSGLSVADTVAVDYTLLFPNANDVVLGYVIDFSGIGQTFNQQSVSNNLQNVLLAGGGGLNAMLLNLANITDLNTYLAALDRLYPEVYLVNALNSVRSATNFANVALNCENRSRLPGGEGLDPSAINGCFWAEVFGGETEWDRTGVSIGHDTDVWGIRGGAEFAVFQDWLLGFAFSHEQTDTATNNPASSDGNSIQIAGTAKTNWNGVDLGATVHAGWGDFDVTRPIGLAGTGPAAFGGQDVQTIGARIQASQTFDIGGAAITPQLALGVVNVDSDGISETGAGPASLMVSGFSETFFYLNPSVEATTSFAVAENVTVDPFVRVGAIIYNGERISTTSSFSGAPIGVPGFQTISDLDQVVFEVSTGANMDLTDNAKLGLRYEGAFSDNSTSHQGTLRLQIGLN